MPNLPYDRIGVPVLRPQVVGEHAPHAVQVEAVDRRRVAVEHKPMGGGVILVSFYTGSAVCDRAIAAARRRISSSKAHALRSAVSR